MRAHAAMHPGAAPRAARRRRGASHALPPDHPMRRAHPLAHASMRGVMPLRLGALTTRRARSGPTAVTAASTIACTTPRWPQAARGAGRWRVRRGGWEGRSGGEGAGSRGQVGRRLAPHRRMGSGGRVRVRGSGAGGAGRSAPHRGTAAPRGTTGAASTHAAAAAATPRRGALGRPRRRPLTCGDVQRRSAVAARLRVPNALGRVAQGPRDRASIARRRCVEQRAALAAGTEGVAHLLAGLRLK